MSSVIELTPNDFAVNNPQKLSDKYIGKITIVKFYSPQCGHCINSQPEYENLANTLKKDPKYIIAKFNCVNNYELMSTLNKFSNGYRVEGYPTHIIFVDSLYFENYEGKRDMNSILNRLTKINTFN